MLKLQELAGWIIGKGLSTNNIGDILEGVAEGLITLGYPLLRASITMPAIDPLQRGFSVAWQRSSSISVDIQGHDEAGQEMFRRSPISYLVANGLRYGRWKLPSDEYATLYPLLKELSDLGATDYLLKLTAYPEGTALAGVGFSLAGEGPGGFSERQIADLDIFLPSLALACYRIAATRIATDMLAVYTGTRTSGRILSGQTQRGEGAAIYAAILLADLKNFTLLNENHAPNHIVAWLNEHFETIGRPVEQEGGEILKFMGDSLLAIFPADMENPAEACRRALSAAKEAQEANATLNRRRLAAAQPEILVDIVLHVGEVFYGNVGAVRRLDFTAIGKAVNEAARIEKLCDTVDRSLLASKAFASHFQALFEKVGTFSLKGVTRPAEIYALAE
ncbi:adenylate/guanylate cyclase domain-containing protein [Rhizobium calliandrae]|uniref:Adenylate/guanylate cyclase domain-containing protein n=1 Tax=Rhizobium calliandrae TaxID=1312182 RepID=A0ABT7KSX0_9HYPH|nr:adenylate/guanylate cyclase domain-containing protein [Rhizobium calliandrae]MDL2410693.1 adenylate/guanylate cyclase domain-containing protein [Rhizobium calliandrae]